MFCFKYPDGSRLSWAAARLKVGVGKEMFPVKMFCLKYPDGSRLSWAAARLKVGVGKEMFLLICFALNILTAVDYHGQQLG